MAGDVNGNSGHEAARVTRTGIALVHEGEVVLPAAGSEVQAERVLDDARAVIQYVFPVEIEVVRSAAEIDLEALIDGVLEQLAEAVRSP